MSFFHSKAGPRHALRSHGYEVRESLHVDMTAYTFLMFMHVSGEVSRRRAAMTAT